MYRLNQEDRQSATHTRHDVDSATHTRHDVDLSCRLNQLNQEERLNEEDSELHDAGLQCRLLL